MIDLNAHFESVADDLADVLKQIGNRWGAEEQYDNDDPDNTQRKRVFFCYAYPQGDQPAFVEGVYWYGKTGNIQIKGDGRVVRIDLSPACYEVARIRIDVVPDQGEEFLIDGEHLVHTAQQLRDRMIVMWNSDEWGMKTEYIEENAALHEKYTQTRSLFESAIKPVGTLFRKMSAAWGGEEQVDNTPDPDDEQGGGGLFGGGRRDNGKKRTFIGYVAPTWTTDDKGKASVNNGALWIDFWTGKKGTLQKSDHSRRIHLEEQATRIAVIFMVDESVMVLESHPEIQTTDPDQMRAALGKLWKQDAFGLKT